VERLAPARERPAFGSNKVFDLFQYSPTVSAQEILLTARQVGIFPDGTVSQSAQRQIDPAFRPLGAILERRGLGLR